jgi:hypothetical protein
MGQRLTHTSGRSARCGGAEAAAFNEKAAKSEQHFSAILRNRLVRS